jgi:hypothetical protein
MESERDERDQERVRALRHPRRDYNAYEPDDESNRIDGQRDTEEKWREINRRCTNRRARRGGLKWRRPDSGERRAESGEQRGVIAISRSVLPTGQERRPSQTERGDGSDGVRG